MTNIEINNCVYKVHPVYNLYASDKNGNIIHLVRQVDKMGKSIISFIDLHMSVSMV